MAQGSTLLPTALIIVRLKAYHYDDQENFSYKVSEFTSIVKAKEVKCVEKISNEKFKTVRRIHTITANNGKEFVKRQEIEEKMKISL